ncbi:MAG: M48 family metallopeptidase [Bacteroidetes bacterium]|nr:M48 family metallopeptidase [Bacteroidota bacterium]
MNILISIIAIIIVGFLLERFLEYLNTKNWSDTLPTALKDFYNEEEYRKSQQYDKANKKLGLISDSLNLIILVSLLLSGLFGKLDDWLLGITGDSLKTTLFFFGILALGSDIINMPFSIYKTFVIEQKFGFNKTTPGLYITDKIKGYVLGALLGGSLIALFSIIYETAGQNFWIYTWIVFSVLMIFVSMFYTSLLLPLFNKLKPLEEGELKSSITSYCSKTCFKMSNIMVMDGSKRSAKANAFFSGLGSRKKIVLFDTLIEKHTIPELVSVLAHETGHYKLRHTQTGLLASILQSGLMLFLFSLFMESKQIATAMGGSLSTIELGLFAFGILYTPVSMVTGLLSSLLSRKHEFEADRYAAETSDGSALKDALKKLSVNNLSNLNPHPAYVFFYYSHPPLLQRLNALDKVIRNA